MTSVRAIIIVIIATAMVAMLFSLGGRDTPPNHSKISPPVIYKLQTFLRENGYTGKEGQTVKSDGKIGPITIYAYGQYSVDVREKDLNDLLKVGKP